MYDNLTRTELEFAYREAEKRIAELEKGNAELKEENTNLKVYNEELLNSDIENYNKIVELQAQIEKLNCDDVNEETEKAQIEQMRIKNEIHIRRNKDMEIRKIVRANGAGVFFGEVVEENGDVVVMTNARRLWKWDGASSLSELAQYGTCRPSECKFPCAVDKVKIFNVLEILDVTEDAGKSIDGVEEWKQR